MNHRIYLQILKYVPLYISYSYTIINVLNFQARHNVAKNLKTKKSNENDMMK